MRDHESRANTEYSALLTEFFDAGLLLATGVPGVYGHSAIFEDVRERLGDRLTAEAKKRGAERVRFPPLLPKRILEESGYLESFPHLAGSVFSFEGDEKAASVQSERARLHEDWSESQTMTDLTLVPAACYPAYPAIAARGPLPPDGAFIDMGASWVFRHEPSEDPFRRQIFHQHELVRVGSPETVLKWRAEWTQLATELLGGLGLSATVDNANDPFFGRRGRMLAASQRDQELKLELLVQLVGEAPTAMASFNHHRDHFAVKWGIQLADGGIAHTACVGFGHERIVLALFRTHGADPAGWPASVRAELALG
jgi:seryl-tRNA synthetase